MQGLFSIWGTVSYPRISNYLLSDWQPLFSLNYSHLLLLGKETRSMGSMQTADGWQSSKRTKKEEPGGVCFLFDTDGSLGPEWTGVRTVQTFIKSCGITERKEHINREQQQTTIHSHPWKHLIYFLSGAIRLFSIVQSVFWKMYLHCIWRFVLLVWHSLLMKTSLCICLPPSIYCFDQIMTFRAEGA